jgi:nucleotide-binding universal stress UspA family protein
MGFSKGRDLMIEHILVPLDGSSLAERVLPHVMAIAGPFKSRVTLLKVMSKSSSNGIGRRFDPLDWQMREAEARAYLNRLKTQLSQEGLDVTISLVEGEPATRIVEFVQNNEVDLIILSSHGGSGLTGWNISSVVQKTVIRVQKPTMIVRAYQTLEEGPSAISYKRLLVPLDGSQRAECVLPMASALAAFHNAELLLAHVVRKPELPRRAPPSKIESELARKLVNRNREEATRYLRQIKSRFPGQLKTYLFVGDDVANTLHEIIEREGPDLVLMSAHGYSGSTQWPYGSLALNFIAYGATPLLVVQDIAEDNVSPSTPEVGASQERQGH